jgi:aryl-alcohol dehydrogenase-like predicted oxidoreductase
VTTTTLGQNGPTVTALGIGTWAWGDTLFWGYGNRYGAADVEAAFGAAIAAGVTFFDTAEIYGFGESERLLGRFMQSTPTPVRIATKYGPAPWRLSGSAVSEALSASLKRLQTDHVALYQVHWPFTFLMSQQTLMQALAEAFQQGRIGAVGVSNYSAEQMTQAHKLLAQWGVPLAANQVRYSLITRQIEAQGILKTAKQLGVTLLAYSPLAQGLLTGKYTPDHPPSGARKLDVRFQPQGLAKLSPVLELLQQLAEHHGRTPAQVALNWLMAQGSVIPIPGAKNAKQAEQNAGTLGWSLSSAEVVALEQVSRPWLD